jgi:hypothetical protein
VGFEGAHPRPKTPIVAIVGIGPKGLYCLEALVAEFSKQPLRTGLQVAIFNKSSHFGVSPIYDTDQPSYLLSNIRAKEINLWDSDGFVHWYNTQFRPSKPLDPEIYPPRAMVGRYLRHGFQRVMSRLPHGLRVSKFMAEVTDIVPDKAGYRLRFIESDGRPDELLAHKILLSTGHSFVRPARRERHYRRFAARHPETSFIPYAYPVAENMSGIPAGACVAMKGMGLTFIDAVLTLTEGRGGIFKREAGGRLCYLMSGQEPKMITPFCRTGLPMAPKPCDFPSTLRPLTFVTAARLNELRRRAPRGKLDLDRDIWPLAELEMELQYYRTAMANLQDRRELDECGDDARAMRQVVRNFLRAHPDVAPLNYSQILDPVGGRRFMTGEEYHAFVECYLKQEIDYARDGLASSPARAAVSMWFEIRAALKPFVAYGGLTSRSHRLLIEHYFPLFKRVVFGPPLINIEKILALHRAGILDFSVARNPRIIAHDSTGCFELRTSSPEGMSAQADVLVDARYPTVEILRDVSPLYQSLCRRRMIREFTNVSAGTAYATGAIDMSRDTHYVINRRGDANEDITVNGAPTEGNLIGNFVISRDGYATVWAASILKQLRMGAE